jgi:hypothetical protein
LLWSTYTSVADVGAVLSPDGADVVLTGSPRGGAVWTTAAFDTATGTRRWLVSAAEGNAAIEAVVDGGRVYVAGQGVTGAGTPAIAYFMTVVAYDRATGTRLWRNDKKPVDASSAAGLRMALAPDGSLVVTGQAVRGFLDWYTVAFETSGLVRWEAVRDGGLNTDEIPAAVLTLSDGTTVVTGRGGPNLSLADTSRVSRLATTRSGSCCGRRSRRKPRCGARHCPAGTSVPRAATTPW